jgi:hypothetical protein
VILGSDKWNDIRSVGDSKSDNSSPSMNSSSSTSDPASPNARSPIIISIARSASSILCATTTPFPAASPQALTTIGTPSRRTAFFGFVEIGMQCCLRRLERPLRASLPFANDFDVSIRAALCVGPKIFRPFSRNTSTIPASSGNLRSHDGEVDVRSLRRRRRAR